MDRISINLLPPELKQNKSRERKKVFITRISIGLLGIMITLTAGLLVISVVQKNRVSSAENKLESSKNQLANYREQEAAIMVLRSRLSTIQQITDKNYPPVESFNLMTALTPEDLQMQNFLADASNNINLQGISPNAISLQLFFDNLVDPKTNEGKVAKSTIQSLSRGPTPNLLFNLNITTKNLKK